MQLKCMIFENQRLKREAFGEMIKFVILQKRRRRVLFRTYKQLSKRYLAKALYSLQVYRQDQYIKRQNSAFIRSYYIQRQKNLLQRQIVQQWRDTIAQSQDKAKFLEVVLDRQLLKNGFHSFQAYSGRLQDINEHMMSRRWFNFLRQYKQIQDQKRQQRMTTTATYQRNLLSRGLQELKRGTCFQKECSLAFANTLSSLQKHHSQKKALFQIDRHVRLKDMMLIVDQKQTMLELKYSFHQLVLNSRLKVFSDALAFRMILGKFFGCWKDSALEDKRIIKLMARAAKHYNRKLKSRYFLNLKRKICPGLFILPQRRLILLSKVIEALKRVRVQGRVLKFRISKVQANKQIATKNEYFKTWLNKARDQSNLRQQEENMDQLSTSFQRKRVFIRSLKAWKKFSYQRRVLKYLKHRESLKILSQSLRRMKELYISCQTEKLRERRGMMVYNQFLKKKALFSLAFNSKSKRQQEGLRIKALNQYKYLLAKKSLLSLFKNTQYQKYKRSLIDSAVQENNTFLMRQVFTKLLQVGFYWATIHQRFGISSRQSRIYLGLKYGMRWRAKTLIIKHLRMQNSQKSKPSKMASVNLLKQVERRVTEAVQKQITVQIQNSNANRNPLPLSRNGSSMAQGSPMRQLNQNPSSQMSQQHRVSSISGQYQSQSPARQGLQRQNSQSSLQSQNLSRIREIEQEILVFKNKKSLLKELESQIKLLQQQQSARINGGGDMLELMKGKYQSLRSELVLLQPKIKQLLEEIVSLKNGGVGQSLSQTQNLQMNLPQYSGEFNQTFLSQNDPSFMLSKTMTSFVHQ